MGLQGQISKDHTQGTVAWQIGLFVWKAAPGLPVSALPPSHHGKGPIVSSVSSRAKARASVQSFCFTLKLSPAAARTSAAAAGSHWTHVVTRARVRAPCNLATRAASASHEEEGGGRGGEHTSLFPGIILSLGSGWATCFFKRTNQLPELSGLWRGFHPRVRRTGLRGPAPSLVPRQPGTRGGGGRVDLAEQRCGPRGREPAASR